MKKKRDDPLESARHPIFKNDMIVLETFPTKEPSPFLSPKVNSWYKYKNQKILQYHKLTCVFASVHELT